MPRHLIALIFLALSALFVAQALTNHAFQDWLFAHHHNILSWYIRPLLLIPIMLAAWWRSWAGLNHLGMLMLRLLASRGRMMMLRWVLRLMCRAMGEWLARVWI